ncbi:MAG: hypothetical protein JXR88_14475 [Clostridia bacterium]|nr:hypothetical protein [Clostridia bacterium]
MINGKSALMTVGYLKSIGDDVKEKIQEMLFELKDKSERDQFEFDYLQVFKLRQKQVNGKNVQVIEHEQEVPDYYNRISFQSNDPIDEKVFVITDDLGGGMSVMTFLLYSEY